MATARYRSWEPMRPSWKKSLRNTESEPCWYTPDFVARLQWSVLFVVLLWLAVLMCRRLILLILFYFGGIHCVHLICCCCCCCCYVVGIMGFYESSVLIYNFLWSLCIVYILVNILHLFVINLTFAGFIMIHLENVLIYSTTAIKSASGFSHAIKVICLLEIYVDLYVLTLKY
jgi:hypothetical protein